MHRVPDGQDLTLIKNNLTKRCRTRHIASTLPPEQVVVKIIRRVARPVKKAKRLPKETRNRMRMRVFPIVVIKTRFILGKSCVNYETTHGDPSIDDTNPLCRSTVVYSNVGGHLDCVVEVALKIVEVDSKPPCIVCRRRSQGTHICRVVERSKRFTRQPQGSALRRRSHDPCSRQCSSQYRSRGLTSLRY